MFDCIIPTAFAQQGLAFTSTGRVKLPRGIYARSKEPLDAQCLCSTCREYTRGYLHHLCKAGEYLAQTLIGIHNLSYYANLMRRIRQHILDDTFLEFYRTEREIVAEPDQENPVRRPKHKNRKGREQLGDYELHRTPTATFIKQRSSGEVMHSVTAPSEEAEILYIQQANLRDRLRRGGERPLVIWDVGLGAATNAMAVVACYEQAKSETEVRQVELLSFESDLDSLRLALLHPNEFHHVRHAAPHSLLREKCWRSQEGGLRWTLVNGDFLETMRTAPAPDLIFYDPFSSKVDSALWTLDCFEQLAHLCHPETQLFTYSAATGVRAGLLSAGFFVARGVPVGPKEETTIALRNGSSSNFELLDQRWLLRWERSQNRYPWNCDPRMYEKVNRRVREHEQFKVTPPQWSEAGK